MKGNEMKWKEMKGNERKWKEMKGNEQLVQNQRNMHANERKNKGNDCNMKGTWKEHECKMKATWKLPKHLKPTKQLLDRFPSLFRNGFWLHFGSRICLFHLISSKPWKAIGPPKSDNHNKSNYPDVKDFDGRASIYIYMFFFSWL